MALARIYSRYPQHTTGLCRDLQQQGYEVEVLNPEIVPTRPADLEIQYEVCDAESALLRAGDLAAQMQADVAVASGVLPVYMRQTPSEGEVESEYEVSSREQREAEVRSPAETESSVRQPSIDRPAPPTVEEQVQGRPVVPELREQLFKTFSRSTNTALTALSAWVDWIRGRGTWFLQKIREHGQHSALRAAEARALREEQLLELTCRRAEAERRSQQMAAARRAAAEYLSELHRAAVADVQIESGAGEIAVPPVPAKGEVSIEQKRTRRTKAIAAGAAAAGACFALVLGLATLHSGSQHATAPAPSAPPAAVVTAPTAPPSPPSRPSPAIRKRSPEQARASQAKLNHRPSSADDTGVANDVTVRHFAPPKSLQSRVSKGVKHYSDQN